MKRFLVSVHQDGTCTMFHRQGKKLHKKQFSELQKANEYWNEQITKDAQKRDRKIK
jgi:hypothetical protein